MSNAFSPACADAFKSNAFAGNAFGGASVTPLTPADFSGLILWLRGDSFSGQSNGTQVSSWEDLSGNGGVVSQSTSGYRPTVQNGIIGSQPVVRFDGTDDFLNISGVAGTASGLTVVIVGQRRSGGGYDGIPLLCNNVAAASLTFWRPTQWEVTEGPNSMTRYTTKPRWGEWAVASYVSGPSGRFVHINNRLNASAAASAFADITPVKLGSYSGSFFDPIDVAEMVVYNRELTSSERLALSESLAARWDNPQPALPVILCEGDSITAGSAFGETPWPTLMQTTLTTAVANVVNLAASGNTLQDTIDQFDAQVATWVCPWATDSNQSIVYFCGTNDNGGTAEAAITKMQSYCELCKAAGITMILVTMLPRTGVSEASFRTPLNDWIRANYTTYGTAIADVGADATIGVAGAYSDTTYYQADGVHLKTAGQTIVADIVRAAVLSSMGI